MQSLVSVRKNKFRKITWKLNYLKNLKPLQCIRTPPHLWMVSVREYFLFLINTLTHFNPMFHLFLNQVLGLHNECTLQSQQSTMFISHKTCENIKYTFLKQTSRWVEICTLFVRWVHKTSLLRLSCIFICESSSQHVTTLKRLVTIGILILREKMLL